MNLLLEYGIGFDLDKSSKTAAAAKLSFGEMAAFVGASSRNDSP